MRPWVDHIGAMMPRWAWTGISLLVVSVFAVALTAWQEQVDRSVFDRYFGAMRPVGVMTGVAAVGIVALAHLEATSDFSVVGPGNWRDAVSSIAWSVPLLTTAVIGADILLRFAEDTNVAMPDALRFYPAIAVFVEIVFHAVPIALLVKVFGMPSGLNASFWKIAIPVALIEAVLQAVYATSIGTSIFSAVHLLVFGIAQVWMFWRFGFVWMLGFRLAYYSLWHLAWGAVRLEVLF